MWSRLLEEESTKRAELEQIHLRQQRAISETEAEKQELEKERLAKESALQAAMTQLEHLEKERQGALEQYQVSCTTLSPDTKMTPNVFTTWCDCVAALRVCLKHAAVFCLCRLLWDRLWSRSWKTPPTTRRPGSTRWLNTRACYDSSNQVTAAR